MRPISSAQSRMPEICLRGTRECLGLGLLFAALGFAGCAGTPDATPVLPPVAAPEAHSQAPADRPIEAGEVIDIFVLEDESFNGRYLVRGSGDVIIPKIGRVTLVGFTPSGAEQRLQDRLAIDQLRDATVIVERSSIAKADKPGSRTTDVYLTGKVNRPGRASLPAIGDVPPTGYQAILDAGGFAKFADKKRSYLLRRSRDGRVRRVPLDFLAIERGEGRDVPVQSGDYIVVPEKTFGF